MLFRSAETILFFLPLLCKTLPSLGQVFVADITPIDGGGLPDVSGTVYVFTNTEDWTEPIGYIGQVDGLEADLGSAECTAANGCGVHIHSGFGCGSADEQEGHYYVGVASDPWTEERYTSDGTGSATFGGFIDIGTDNVQDRAFVVHNQAGGRVGCGLLRLVTDQTQLLTVATEPLDSYGVEGSVLVYNDGSGMQVFAGHATNLEPNIDAAGGTDCTDPNGCGTHIHSGTSCADSDSQGGHFYDSAISDPWATVGYTETDSAGAGTFIHMVTSDVTDINGKAFIIHLNDGSRTSCGILADSTSDDVESLCFSSMATVDVENKGRTLVKDIEVGDKVLTSENKYKLVYTVDHQNPEKWETFVQIYSTANDAEELPPLELTKSHMVFIDGKENPVPASAVKVGDALQTVNGPSIVSRISSVKRKGIWNPVTVDGTIVVDGIVTSTYNVPFRVNDSEDGGIGVAGVKNMMSHHDFLHFLMTPYRVMCIGMSLSFCETTTEHDEFNGYSRLGINILKFFNNTQGRMAQDTMILVAVQIAFVFKLLSFLFWQPIVGGAVLGTGIYCFAWKKNKISKGKLQ